MYRQTKKVTYNKIQDYVKEKYYFFAHSTYIAEVKRECGLDVEPYNSNRIKKSVQIIDFKIIINYDKYS